MIFAYGLFSKIADRSPVTAPMVFVAMGILVGPVGLNFFDLEVKGELIPTYEMPDWLKWTPH